jgi:LysR family transcriptional regulator, glycine cleavage system transcriptional activator
MHRTHALNPCGLERTNEKIAVDTCAYRMYRGGMKPPRSRTSARSQRPIGLSALRGFEASARRMSFTLAAAELNLTQSSISRQVAELERQIGTVLFARQTRSLALTAAGHRLFQAAQQALKQIDRAVEDIRGPRNAARVTITTYASFASLWLVPRLAMFQREHPQIELRIDASDRFIDIDAEGVDVAIRWTRATSLPSGAAKLHDEEVLPAMSPLLLERSGVALKEPQDLFQLPLLELDESMPTSASSAWSHWFQFAGVRSAPPAPRLMFTFVDQSVQAAVRGQGVVLTRTPFVDELVASGDLITPFPKLRMPTGYQYALIANVNTRETAHVAAFCSWIRAEFKHGPLRQT